MQRKCTSRVAAAVSMLVLAALVAAVLVVAFRDAPAKGALAAPAAERVSNDNFGAPTLQIYGDLPFESRLQTTGATLEAGETAPCGNIGATVWFEFTPQTQGTVEITTAGSSFDTIAALYTLGNGFLPSPPGANLNSVACNDDANGQTSFLSLPLTQFMTYYIQIGGKDGATGELALRIACNPACPPTNDDSAAAAYIGVDAYNSPVLGLSADTRAATDEAGEPKPCGNIGKTVWYQFYANSDETIVADTSGSGFDTVLAAYTYGGDFPASPPGGFTPLACGDTKGREPARIRFAAKQGNQYWIQAGGVDGASGDLSLNVSCDPICPPFNDSLGSYGSVLPPYEEQLPTGGATLQDGEPRPCGTIGKTVWYSVYVTGHVTVVADTAGSDFETVAAAYDAPYGTSDFTDLHSLGCESGGAAGARISFQATTDRQFFVQLGGRSGASGNLNFHLDCDPSPCPPENDGAANAQYVGVPGYFPLNSSEDTRGATVESGEPRTCGDMAHTVWFALETSQAVTLEFDTATSDYETALAVYTQGPDFVPPAGSAQPVGCSVSAAGKRARVQFRIEPKTIMYLQVGAANGGAGGLLQLVGNCVPACPPQNDNSANALYIYLPGDWETTIDTTGATLEPGEPRRCGDIGATVWYRVYAAEDGRLRASTEGSQFATALAVYEAAEISPPGAITDIGCSDAVGGAALEFDVAAGKDYWVQVGGVADARGLLSFKLACLAGCISADGRPLNARPGTGGAIAGPDTGNGGYLPSARAPLTGVGTLSLELAITMAQSCGRREGAVLRRRRDR